MEPVGGLHVREVHGAGRGSNGGSGRAGAGWARGGRASRGAGGDGRAARARDALEGGVAVAAALHVPEGAIGARFEVHWRDDALDDVSGSDEGARGVEVEMAQGGVVVAGHEEVVVPLRHLVAGVDRYTGGGVAASSIGQEPEGRYGVVDRAGIGIVAGVVGPPAVVVAAHNPVHLVVAQGPVLAGEYA